MARPTRVSDAEYLARYEREVRHYVLRYSLVRDTAGPGEAFLSTGRWVWIEPDDDNVARWQWYAKEHRGLKELRAWSGVSGAVVLVRVPSVLQQRSTFWVGRGGQPAAARMAGALANASSGS